MNEIDLNKNYTVKEIAANGWFGTKCYMTIWKRLKAGILQERGLQVIEIRGEQRTHYYIRGAEIVRAIEQNLL